MPDHDETTAAPVVGSETSADPERDGGAAGTGSGASGAPGADSGPVEDKAGDPVEDQDGAGNGQDDPGDPGDEDGDEDRDERGNREAARRRRELREARAERDRLAGVVERFQRRDVERFVGGKLADCTDVWRDGLTLADVLDDEGTVDEAKLSAVVEALVEAHPHWGPPSPEPDYRRLGGGGRGSAPTPKGIGTEGLRDALAAAAGRGRRPF